jgi:hypothetical protein
MTIDEFAQYVGKALRDAYNQKDQAAVQTTFSSADQTLRSSGVGERQIKEFWEAVQRIMLSGHLLVEKQANSSLVALMRAIETALSARIK